MPRSILVTGAGGSIGRATTAHLLECGYAVVALVAAGDLVPEGVAHVVVGDCRDPSVVDQAIRGSEAVVHLAARTGRPFGTPAEMLQASTMATAAVLNAAAQHGIPRAIIASSQAVYGHVYAPEGVPPLRLPLSEETRPQPQDTYALAKQCDEAVASMVSRSSQTSVLAYRFPYTTTASNIRQRQRLVRDAPESAASELWSYLLIDDAARSIRSGLDAALPGFHAVNIAAPDTLSPEPTATLVAKYHPTATLTMPLPGRVSPVDTRLVEQLIGFRARCYSDAIITGGVRPPIEQHGPDTHHQPGTERE